MEQILEKIQSVTIVIFMAGNLLDVGLRLSVSEALAALRNARFLVHRCCGVLSWVPPWPSPGLNARFRPEFDLS